MIFFSIAFLLNLSATIRDKSVFFFFVPLSLIEDSETNVEPIKEFNEEETNKKLDEIITVSVNDDDTETVDNFISDISSLMEKKGVEVEKEVKSYTLFDDASENE